MTEDMVAYDEVGSLVPIKRTLQVTDCQNQANKDLEEPSNKRVRSLGRVTSLANLISPVKNGAVRRFGQTIQASFRGDGKLPGVPQKPCSKAAAPTPPKRRNSTLWSETLDIHQKGTFSTKEIKRQELLAAEGNNNKHPDTLWDELKEAVVGAAESKIGRRRGGFKERWISDRSWELIDQRRLAKSVRDQVAFDPHASADQRERAMATYQDLARQVKRSCRRDKREWIEAKGIEAQEAADRNDTRTLYLTSSCDDQLTKLASVCPGTKRIISLTWTSQMTSPCWARLRKTSKS
nr:PREDICTED: uncharacterized protein LOC102205648 [Pundamilia nyererei]